MRTYRLPPLIRDRSCSLHSTRQEGLGELVQALFIYPGSTGERLWKYDLLKMPSMLDLFKHILYDGVRLNIDEHGGQR